MISLEVFIVLLIPHLIWLYNNDFASIVYGLKRTGLEDSSVLDHIRFPLIFLIKQIGILIPFLFLLWLLVKKFKLKINYNDKKFIFLIFVNILPIVLMFLTSLVTGSEIRTMWMTPFYLFFGVLFIYLLKSQINIKRFNSFLYGFLFLFFYYLLFIHLSQFNKLIKEQIILEKKLQN